MKGKLFQKKAKRRPDFVAENCAKMWQVYLVNLHELEMHKVGNVLFRRIECECKSRMYVSQTSIVHPFVALMNECVREMTVHQE